MIESGGKERERGRRGKRSEEYDKCIIKTNRGMIESGGKERERGRRGEGEGRRGKEREGEGRGEGVRGSDLAMIYS